MKFLLVLHLCSMITQTCPNMMYPQKVYESWSECIDVGYKISQLTFNKLDKNVVNKQKLAIKFECKEISTT